MKTILYSNRTIIAISTFSLFFINGCIGQPSGGYGGGGALNILPLLLLSIIIIGIPLIKAFQAAKESNKFKTLVFITTFYEWIGWILCVTIIGIPFGLGLVLLAQVVRVIIDIERNTNRTSS